VDRKRALDALPPPYGTALRLRDGGADRATVARAVEVPLDAIDSLLAIGERKLAALLDDDDPDVAGATTSTQGISLP
jgi:DNA-directed RNA polymerase specialized sigma24 family protein